MATVTSSTYTDQSGGGGEGETYYLLEINHSFELVSSYWGSEESDPGLSHARHDSSFAMTAQIYLVNESGGANTRTPVGCNITGPGQEYQAWEYSGVDSISANDIVYSSAEGIVPSNVVIIDSPNATTEARMFGNYFDIFPGSGKVLPNERAKAPNASFTDATGATSTVPNYYQGDPVTYARLSYEYAANSDFLDVIEYSPNSTFGVTKNYVMTGLGNSSVSFTVPIWIVNNLDYSRDFLTEMVSRSKQALYNNIDNKPIRDVRQAPVTKRYTIPNATGYVNVRTGESALATLYLNVPELKTEQQVESYRTTTFANATPAKIQAAANAKRVEFGNTEFQPAESNTEFEGTEPAITGTSNSQLNIITPTIPTPKG